MKIGIYGDSYADTPDRTKSTNWFNILSKLIFDDKPLLNNLTKDSSKITIDNFGKGGSSLYFSYKNFLETSTDYDLVIFLVTEPHRYPIAFKPANINQTFYITSIPHVDQLIESLSSLLNESEKQFLIDLRGWFAASDQEYNRDMSSIILDNIETLHSKLIMYPCFTESFTSNRYKKHKLDPYLHPLHSFWHRQLELFDIEPSNFTALEKDTLSGHLVPEFNEYFAKVLFTKLKHDKWDHAGFFDIKIDMPKTHYYKNWD